MDSLPQTLYCWPSKTCTSELAKCVLLGSQIVYCGSVATSGYVPRIADRRLASLLAGLPAVMVTGPRAAGKTTSARRIANDVLRLDDPAVATAVAANPDAALRRVREPVLLDEWQEVPEILGAVKRAVDDDPRPGRFLLTGSVEADFTTRQWPGTGRVVRLVLHGLTEREIARSVDQSSLLDLLLNSDISQLGISGPPRAWTTTSTWRCGAASPRLPST